MPVYLEELLELARAQDLEIDETAGYLKIPAGPARQSPHRIYIAKVGPGSPIRNIHLSGFTLTHPAVKQISKERATELHLGNVRGAIDGRSSASREVLEAFALAVSRVAGGSTRADDPSEDHLGPDAATELLSVPLARLEAWVASRIGYGHADARAWFLGMEEAMDDILELPARIAGPAVEDLATALVRIGSYPDLLTDAPPLQPTWAPLIRAWLVARDKAEPSRDEVRSYQRHEWGRAAGETLLAELLPLPSPSTKAWPYTRLGLGDRRTFKKRWLARRREVLSSAWRNSSVTPRVAVAYGKTYWPEYRTVFGLAADASIQIDPTDSSFAEGYVTNGGVIALVRHPVAFGNSTDHWHALGRWLSQFV